MVTNYANDEYKYKLLVFGISSLIAGLMGSFYAHYLGQISPAIFALDFFLLILLMLLAGGLGVFPGAAIGAFTITIINELLRVTLLWRYVILGVIVVVTMMFLPKGVMGIPDLFRAIYRRYLSRNRTTTEEASSD